MREDSEFYFPKPEDHLQTYTQPIMEEMRCILIYGIGGGGVTGLVLLPTRIFLGNIVANPSYNQLFIPFVAGLVIILLIGLCITLMVLDRRWQPHSRTSQILTGAGIGALFGLTANHISMSNMSAIIAHYPLWDDPFINGYPSELAVQNSVYATILLGYLTAAVTILLMTLFGMLFSLAMLRIEKSKPRPPIRDTFGSFAMLFLPITLLITEMVMIVIYAIIDFNDYAFIPLDTPASLPVVYLMIFVLPPIMLLVQILGLIWLWRTKALNLHRSLLRLTQIVYGAFGLLLWPFVNLIQPGFANCTPGREFTLLSSGLALAFSILAQFKLRRAHQLEQPIQIRIAARSLFGVGLAVVIIGWMLINDFGFGVFFNLITFTVPLVQGQLQLGDFNHLIPPSNFHSQFINVGWFALILISVVAWQTALIENKRALS